MGLTHGFRYGYGPDASGGNPYWEQPAQWQACQAYAEQTFTAWEFADYYKNYNNMFFMKITVMQVISLMIFGPRNTVQIFKICPLIKTPNDKTAGTETFLQDGEKNQASDIMGIVKGCKRVHSPMNYHIFQSSQQENNIIINLYLYY